jgi:predicted RND superfamily exporter protein
MAEMTVQAYARWVIKWRWPVLLASVLVALCAAYGMRYLEFTADYRVFLSEDNPELAAFEALEDTYTKTDNVLFVLQPPDGRVFTREALEVVRGLTEASWRIPHAIRVDSVTNFQHTRVDGDELNVDDLVPVAADMSDVALAEVERIALNEPALIKRLIASDARTAGVMVTLQFPGEDHTVHLPEAISFARNLVRELRTAHPDWTFGMTGVAVLSHAEVEVIGLDLRSLVPVMYGLMVALMLVLLRSLSGTVATLAVVSLSAAGAVGLSAWFGMKLNASSALAPVIIMTVAIADCVHILMTALYELREGRSKTEALIESLRVNAEPVFLTSLTTSIGFLSLNFSDAPPFRDLGNIAAMGVFAAWALSMTLLPALVSVLPIRVRPRQSGTRLAMDRFGDFVVAKRSPLLWGVGLGALLVTALIPRIEIDDRFVKWFDRSLAFRVDTDFATANLVGPYSFEFSVASGEAGGIAEPAYLERLEAFATWLRAQPEITHVNSFTDVMKRLNRDMNAGDPDWYRLPERRDLAAQYLLLYEMSLPYGLDLNSQINVDRSATRLTAILDTVPQRRVREVAARAEAWLAANMPPPMQAEATGTIVIFVYLAERNIRSMLVGTSLAFLLISATLVVALRNLRVGLISLLPNCLPVLITFGLWAIFVGHIGIIASIITATTLGLIVDDTVHILSKYSRARAEHCLGTHNAIRFTFSHVGSALWVTTVILVAGFLALGFSSFKLNSEMGLLTAITLVAALAMDFLLLPPLLMLMDKEKQCDCVTCARERALFPAT